MGLDIFKFFGFFQHKFAHFVPDPTLNRCPTSVPESRLTSRFVLDGFVHNCHDLVLCDFIFLGLLGNDPFCPQDIVPFSIFVLILHFHEKNMMSKTKLFF